MDIIYCLGVDALNQTLFYAYKIPFNMRVYNQSNELVFLTTVNQSSKILGV